MPSCNRSLLARFGTICGSIALSLTFLSPSLEADEPASPDAAVATQAPAAEKPAPPTPHHAQTRLSLDERVKRFGRNLDLSATQQAEVKKILEQRQQETLQLRLDPSLDGDARIGKFRALQDTTVARIRAVLTEEQRSKYNPLAPRGIPQAEGQRSVEDWLKLTTPH